MYGSTGKGRITRRGLFGGALAGGAALSLAQVSHMPRAGAVGPGPYIWALNTAGFTVPPNVWTRVPWPQVVINHTPTFVEPSNPANWIFPTATAHGVWAFVANIAWDNARSPSGVPIQPVTHRKQARIPQQSAIPNGVAYLGAATEVTYHADLALRGSQAGFSDGTKGYQQQQVYIQAGLPGVGDNQRFWIEVYQDSGQPLQCRFDGSSVPATLTRPATIGFQAPSLMIERLCDS